MENDILKVIVSAKEIDAICEHLGKEITKDYDGKYPIVIGLLKGCQPFMSDLIKYINTYISVDYMSVSSYDGMSSTGSITIKKDIEVDVKGRDVIVVDDIIDTGVTLLNIINLFKEKHVRSIKTVCLLDKPEGRKVDLNADYVGMIVPKEFVVGYGLDYNGLYRNLPYVGVLKREVYEK